jgi:hypothetical protein
LYVIRHGKTPSSWDTLQYPELLKLVKLENDPEPDMKFLEENLDRQKALELSPKIIYASPLKRAAVTAEYISGITGSEVIKIDGLEEISFDAIPKSVYDRGSESIREYLVMESIKRRRSLDMGLFEEGSMLLTHGFFMRHIYAQVFGENIASLTKSDLFTNYLSGFDTKRGERLSLLKAVKV